MVDRRTLMLALGALPLVAARPPCPASSGEWRTLPTELYPRKQDDIFFSTPARGWYGNGDGKLFTTADGGETWTKFWEQPGTFVRALGFVDERKGFLGNLGVGRFTAYAIGGAGSARFKLGELPGGVVSDLSPYHAPRRPTVGPGQSSRACPCPFRRRFSDDDLGKYCARTGNFPLAPRRPCADTLRPCSDRRCAMGPLDRRSVVGGGLLLLGSATSAVGRQPRARAGAGAPRAMTDVLRAAGPHIEPGEDPQARIFDRFAGTWATDYSFIQDDGTRQISSGQFIAGWVLDGRALQDIWIWDQSGESRPWMGTTLRFFDTERRIWRVTWVTPFARAVLMLEGGLEGDDIVLHADDPSVKRRWSFYDIRSEAFRWKNERSTDGGVTWRLREDHRMRRQSA